MLMQQLRHTATLDYAVAAVQFVRRMVGRSGFAALVRSASDRRGESRVASRLIYGLLGRGSHL